MRTWLIAAAAAGVVASSGCAVNQARGVASNGETLRVVVQNRSYSYHVKEKVGDVTHRDETGRVVGTSELTRDAVRVRRFKVWSFAQGRSPLDEQDFFRLAGDREAYELIKRRRARGIFWNRLGLGLVGAGLVGAVLMTAGGGTVRSVGTTAFSIGLPVGGVMAFYGARKANRKQLPLMRALMAVEQNRGGRR